MAEIEVNPYELLDLTTESTEQEIRTAYRQRSLKVHPDRNRGNPDAARKFHELNQAYELLLDPLRRLALDAKLRLKHAREARFKTYDTKRKNLVEELEERERAFKKARTDKQKEEVERWQETEKIKEEGRRLREEREKEMKRKEEEKGRRDEDEEDAPPALSALDTTVRLKYTLKAHPELTTPSSIAALLSRFGPTDTDSIVLSLKAPKKAATDAPPKYGTALVPFKQLGDAFAAVCASGTGLGGIEVGWVGGKEPEILGWLKRMGKLGTPPPAPSAAKTGEGVGEKKAGLPQTQTRADSSSFSSFPASFPNLPPKAEPNPAGIDYESLTLMRLRHAERERLEREIREQEAAE
ncbi:DnaJ domain-containing protein [Infundibulicybe gibba]|nr:DnaJ domain-containing protein [Infundibulicybe gibba]